MTLAYALSPRFLGAGSTSRKILSGTVVASALYAGYVGFSAFYSVNKRFNISSSKTADIMLEAELISAGKDSAWSTEEKAVFLRDLGLTKIVLQDGQIIGFVPEGYFARIFINREDVGRVRRDKLESYIAKHR
ncbi:TPA: hypothetical protein HA219_02810 [Candidatus Woesearchaeota archaeon]|nr:hypothetical protein [Candidatus Woesearchaeota archaeon]